MGVLVFVSCIAGSIIIAIYAPQEHTPSSVLEVWNLATQPGCQHRGSWNCYSAFVGGIQAISIRADMVFSFGCKQPCDHTIELSEQGARHFQCCYCLSYLLCDVHNSYYNCKNYNVQGLDKPGCEQHNFINMWVHLGCLRNCGTSDDERSESPSATGSVSLYSGAMSRRSLDEARLITLNYSDYLN